MVRVTGARARGPLRQLPQKIPKIFVELTAKLMLLLFEFSIGRRDTAKGYSPENTEWQTYAQGNGYRYSLRK